MVAPQKHNSEKIKMNEERTRRMLDGYLKGMAIEVIGECGKFASLLGGVYSVMQDSPTRLDLVFLSGATYAISTLFSKYGETIRELELFRAEELREEAKLEKSLKNSHFSKP